MALRSVHGSMYGYSDTEYQTFQSQTQYFLKQFLQYMKEIRIYQGTRPTDNDFTTWATTNDFRSADLLATFSVVPNASAGYLAVTVPVSGTVNQAGTATWGIMISDPRVLGNSSIRANCAILSDVGVTGTNTSDCYITVESTTVDTAVTLTHCGFQPTAPSTTAWSIT